MPIKDNQLSFDVETITGSVVDWRLSSVFKMSVTGTVSLSFSNVISGKTILVALTNNTSSAHTVTFSDANVRWTNISNKTLTLNPNTTTLYTFFCPELGIITSTVLDNQSNTVAATTKQLLNFGGTVGNGQGAYLENNILYMWGDGANGVLGNGAITAQSSPIFIGEYTYVATGGQHTVAVDSLRNLYAWGLGTSGQLGDNTIISKSTPTQVLSAIQFSAAECGNTHTVALDTIGQLWGWGTGTTFENGLGGANASVPSQVLGFRARTYSQIGAGGAFSMALTNGGELYVWGLNTSGQLGNNTITNVSSPTVIMAGTSFQQISPGDTFWVALDGLGRAWANGVGTSGQLGDNSITSKSTPVQVAGNRTFSKISAGAGYAAAIQASDGIAYCWGLGTSGQLGDGTILSKSSPVAVLFGRSFVDIKCSGATTYAMESDGTIWAWGLGTSGQIGDVAISSKVYPAIVSAPSHTISKIFGKGNSSVNHAGVLTSLGHVKMWGLGTSGQLGDNSILSKSMPHYTIGPSFTHISTGEAFTAGITALGQAYAWGLGTSGQLGDLSITTKSIPVSVAGGYSFSYITCGAAFAAGLVNGLAYAWGLGTSGQLGDNTILSKSSPVAVAGGRTYSAITTGGVVGRTHAIETSTGLAFSWGVNTNGVLGDSTIINKSSPVAVVGARSFTRISAGGSHTAAIEGATGNVFCWGLGTSGELGDGTILSKSSPVAVLGGRSYSRVRCGTNHTLAIESATGYIYAWGIGTSGQLGDGGITNRTSPVRVAINKSFVDIVAGNACSFALDAEGNMYAWGLGTSGQLGEFSNINRTIPTLISIRR